MEAELGHVAGGEDIAAATEAGALTDPAECGALRAADRRRSARDLDRQRPRQIRQRAAARMGSARRGSGQRIDAPLSLHGASGLPDGDLRRAVGLGIRKINANTELRDAYLRRDRGRAAARGLRALASWLCTMPKRPPCINSSTTSSASLRKVR